MRLRSVLATSVMCLCWSCGRAGQVEMDGAPSFEKGMKIFPSPRTFDGPGTVFRVDGDGVRHPVADLGGLVKTPEREEAIPSLMVTGRIDGGAFFQWLDGTRRGGRLARIDTAQIQVFGAKRQQVFESDLRQLIDSVTHTIDWGRPGKYYVITETVSADSINIRLSRSFAVVIGDSIRADSAKNHGISVAWEPRSSATLALRFPRPYRVFYKVDQLVRRVPLEQDSLPIVIHIPAGVYWREPPPTALMRP